MAGDEQKLLFTDFFVAKTKKRGAAAGVNGRSELARAANEEAEPVSVPDRMAETTILFPGHRPVPAASLS